MNEDLMEISILLDGDVEYYFELLERQGVFNTSIFEIKDKYFSNINFDELCKMTEEDIKKSCLRICNCVCVKGEPIVSDELLVKNYNLLNEENESEIFIKNEDVKKFYQDLENLGWYEIVDSFKVEFRFRLKSGAVIKIQEIDNIGVVVCFYNEIYKNMPENLQREALINELNDYGFEIDRNECNIAKLKTLLTGQPFGCN